ncbi:MAG TPA: pyridoxamine 5'-phosphate oxidase [Acidimicrobiales bacterium]|nr:pyridoxamine 5'-phosphate oxidase [Acidimicrobiales bacterium]
MDDELARLREEYRRASLDEGEVGHDPMALSRAWVAEAVAAGLDEPNAMVLSTVGSDGSPSSRAVLLKGLDDAGFRFFTNYDSVKGRELAADPRCSLVLVWTFLARQIRVSGRAERLPASESDAYFASRPRGARLGALVSEQSRPIADRGVLERRLAEVEAAYPETEEIPRPPHWGGYLVVPEVIEVWNGRPDRLHDRFHFTRATPGAPWSRRRLAP